MRTHQQIISPPPVPSTIPIEYLDSTEVAEILRVSERVVGQYIKSQGLKAARVGKRWLVSRADLDSYISSRVRQPQTN